MFHSEVSDVHICESNPEDSLIFPGPRKPDAMEMEKINALLQRARACNKLDFMIALRGSFFRGRKEARAVDGTWYMLRRMPNDPPTLQSLPSKIQPTIMRALLSPYLNSGGLIYVIGKTGVGKTTTASGVVVSRLLEFGGLATTVEDPPEMPLNGWHGKGYCRQTWVAGEHASDWAESFRSILRSQPVSTNVILFVGEVRDADSARAILRAAASGFLVIATGFGEDIPTGIEALIRLGGDHDAMLMGLSQVMRLVLYQRLVEQPRQNGDPVITRSLQIQALSSLDAKSPVAAKLRAGHIPHLASDVQFQANQIVLGQDIFSRHV